MTDHNNNTPADGRDTGLPTDLERQKIFFWLKKLSSVTAWRRVLEYYEAWAAATQNSLHVAQQNGWNDETSLPQSEYERVTEGLEHCKKAVARLGKGERQVFKFNPDIDFAMARHILSHWSQMLQGIEWDENGIRNNTPGWLEVRSALTKLAQVWGECGPPILEPHRPQAVQLIIYDASLQAELGGMPFPDELGPVPDPADSIFVRSGDYLPCTGIWEPVDMPRRSMLGLLMRKPKPQPPFRIAGTMNYLHDGSRAPQLTVKTAQGYMDQDTTWRLLWRDDRYIDGTVPEEEADYRFSRPHQFQSRPTIINPQEALLLERYTSVQYFERLRDIWGEMVAQVEQSLRRFMQRTPPDYRKRALPEQPDIVWGGRVLPNFRDTYQGLCDGYIQLVKGDLSGLGYAHGPMNDFKGQNDYSLTWMEQEDAEKYWALLIEATNYASNICATIEGYWKPFLLGEEYDERLRGPRVAPAIWPEYRLNPTITVVTGAQPPRAGIYLPDLNDSCLQFLVELVERATDELKH